MDIHRLALYLSIGLGTVALVLNACSVVTGNAWLLSSYVQ